MSRAVDYAALTERRCSRCRISKPVAEFNRYADPTAVLTGWRYYSQCRACSNQQSSRYSKANRPRRNERLQRWRRENPDAARAAGRRKRLRAKYDLTEEKAAALIASRGGMCGLCLVRPAVAIDHDHASGRVRGATCTHCNSVVLARVDADPDFLARVARYVAADEPCHADVLIDLANATTDGWGSRPARSTETRRAEFPRRAQGVWSDRGSRAKQQDPPG